MHRSPALPEKNPNVGEKKERYHETGKMTAELPQIRENSSEDLYFVVLLHFTGCGGYICIHVAQSNSCYEVRKFLL